MPILGLLSIIALAGPVSAAPESALGAAYRAIGTALKRPAGAGIADPYVRACSYTGQPRAVDVSYRAVEVCSKSDPSKVRGSPVGYRLQRGPGGGLVLAADLGFEYKGEPETRASSIDRLLGARGCMARFFGRHGITLDVTMHVDEKPGTIGRVIKLWDRHPHSNVANWAMFETVDEMLSEDQACALAIHEFSHLLGVPDANADESCPDRARIGPPDDIMRDALAGAANQRFYPEQLHLILKPLCGE